MVFFGWVFLGGFFNANPGVKGPCLEMVWALLYGWIPVPVELGDVLFGGLETSPKA